MTLAAVSAFFRVDLERADSSVLRRDYDAYRGLATNPEQHRGVNLDMLFDQDQLWANAKDSVEVPERSLSATRAFVEKIGCNLPVPKKGYVE